MRQNPVAAIRVHRRRNQRIGIAPRARTSGNLRRVCRRTRIAASHCNAARTPAPTRTASLLRANTGASDRSSAAASVPLVRDFHGRAGNRGRGFAGRGARGGIGVFGASGLYGFGRCACCRTCPTDGRTCRTCSTDGRSRSRTCCACRCANTGSNFTSPGCGYGCTRFNSCSRPGSRHTTSCTRSDACTGGGSSCSGWHVTYEGRAGKRRERNRIRRD